MNDTDPDCTAQTDLRLGWFLVQLGTNLLDGSYLSMRHHVTLLSLWSFSFAHDGKFNKGWEFDSKMFKISRDWFWGRKHINIQSNVNKINHFVNKKLTVFLSLFHYSYFFHITQCTVFAGWFSSNEWQSLFFCHTV